MKNGDFRERQIECSFRLTNGKFRDENPKACSTDNGIDLGLGDRRRIAFRSIKQAISEGGLCGDENA